MGYPPRKFAINAATRYNTDMSAKVIAIANQKGGVGKTTSTINIARALHERGQRVLAIDCDPQSSLSIVCGVNDRRVRDLEQAGRTMYHGLVKNTPLADLIIKGELDVIPASIRLANAEQELISPFGAATILRQKIAPLRELYDAIVIDCPPTLSLLTVNALTAADFVVIPVKTDFLSIMGVPLLMETIENVRNRANSNLVLVGILPTMFLATASHDAALLTELRELAAHSKITVFDPVYRATAFDKANASGKSTLELYPDTKGVDQYRVVADKIMTYGT